MTNKKFKSSSTCVAFFLLAFGIKLGGTLLSSGEVKWTNQLVLETGFKIKWDSEDPDFLTMEMSAPTSGYLGIGFSPRGDMSESDIVIAWVDSNGMPHIRDYHGVGKADPIEDPQQDYFLIAAAERDNETIVRFHRRWETCDEQHDISIGADTVKLIWAWHEEDPTFTTDEEGIVSVSSFPWHGEDTRGTRNVFMRLPSQPSPFPDGQDGQTKPDPESDLDFWDLTVDNVDIDGSKNSVYMCKFFKFPKIHYRRQYQMIGFRPTITEENEGNIHRISVYQCHFPMSHFDTEKSTGKQINEGTTECFMPPPRSPAEEEESAPSEEDMEENDFSSSYLRSSSGSSQMGEFCEEYLLSWALGSEGEMLPSHVGILLADRGNPVANLTESYYYKLEVHYDNLSGKQFLDSSGVRIFYTDDSRLFTGGLLSVGHRVSPFLALPPSQENFKIYSICGSDCTGNGIPDGGLNVFSVMLHSHEAGRKIRLRHVRNGKELPPIAEDGNYTYKYQQHRLLKDEVRIFPGDELVLECEYNTMHRDKFTFGGYTADDEKCQALLSYYPRVNLTTCESKQEFQSFFSAFGIRSTMGDGLMRIDMRPGLPMEGSDLLPPQFALERTFPREDEEERFINPFETVYVDKPVTLFNLSVADRMNTFDWMDKRVSKNLENSWKNGRFFMYCEGRSPIPYKKYVREIPRFQKYRINSVCRRSRYKNAGEKKTVEESLIISLALFIKVIFDIRNYFVD